MVATAPNLIGLPAILRLCTDWHATDAQLRQGIDGLRALARQEHTIELRLAMVLAWLKSRDPADLGYSSFGALCRENVDWSRSWIYALIALVESPLEVVKRAACEELIPLRVAVLAPGNIDVAEQAAWLASGALEQLGRRTPRELDTFEGDDAITVRKARRLGRLLMGRHATDREVDDFILAAWRERTPAEALLEAARTPRDPPEPEPLGWAWYENPEADSLLGPWSEPTSPQEALERVHRIQAILRGRRPVLAKAWAYIHHEKVWACAGFQSAEQFANEVLDVSLRTAQRMAKAGWALEWYPELEEAVRAGLPFGAAHELAPVLDEGTAQHWIDIAARVGRRELGLAIEEAKNTTSAEVCARYLEVIDQVDDWWSTRPEPDATTAGHPRVALPHPEPERPSARPLRAPPELPEAGRWLLQHVRIPPRRGFAAVKDRDRDRCQNPECGRLSLCNQAHHLQFRSQGGSDELENGTTTCRACHLRGIHTARIGVERVTVGGAEALLWRYPGRFVLQLTGR